MSRPRQSYTATRAGRCEVEATGTEQAGTEWVQGMRVTSEEATAVQFPADGAARVLRSVLGAASVHRVVLARTPSLVMWVGEPASRALQRERSVNFPGTLLAQAFALSAAHGDPSRDPLTLPAYHGPALFLADDASGQPSSVGEHWAPLWAVAWTLISTSGPRPGGLAALVGLAAGL